MIGRWKPPPTPPAGGWGPAKWCELHRIALAGNLTPARLQTFSASLPNHPCGCRNHWKILLEANPPPCAAPAVAQFAWTVARHNDVNRRLGKPEKTLEEAQTIHEPVLTQIAHNDEHYS